MSAAEETNIKVAVLEQIAKDTRETLGRLERRMDEGFSRLDTKIETVRNEQKSDFRWLLGLGFSALAGVMAHILHMFHMF